MPRPVHWLRHRALLGALCAAAPAGAGTQQAGFAVRIELALPAGCSSSVERTAGGGARVTLTCGANLFVNVRPTLVSAGPAAGDAGSGDGPHDGVQDVQGAGAQATEMWVIF